MERNDTANSNALQSGKIDGAIKFRTTWAILVDAVKPTRATQINPGRKTKGLDQIRNRRYTLK
jgi:hypothetical protein